MPTDNLYRYQSYKVLAPLPILKFRRHAHHCLLSSACLRRTISALKGQDMDANQRSQENNQTDNGANEKWNPGAKGKTTDGPLDHAQDALALGGSGARQQGEQHSGQMGTQQSGMGPGNQEGGEQAQRSGSTTELPGGSMQSQQSGGSGPVKGITDSHQQQMEQRSDAYGKLEQPVGGRSGDPQGSLANRQSAGATGASSAQGSRQATPGDSAKPSLGPQRGTIGASESTDRAGSEADSRKDAEPAVHESNDAAGGYPRSPGGANRLNADEKMSDDTGFSNRQPPIDEGSKQAQQSNVGRRDDMTAD
jgi:hypothetical protein